MNKSILILIILLASAANLFAYEEDGSASYYSDRLHGRKTASGECYHKNKYTCAHRDLPFGTLLKVTNQHNGKSVIVKVNDRGPFHRKRIIDLSFQAAQEIGMIGRGVTHVTIEQVKEMPLDLPSQSFQLEVALKHYHLDTRCIPDKLVR